MNKINICYLITEEYVELTLQSISSVRKFFKSTDHELVFFVLSEDNLQHIPGVNIITLPRKDIFLTHRRSYIPEILDVDRLIFLDSDTIVMTNILNLWETDIGNNIIGAVQHAMLPTIGCMIDKYQISDIFPEYIDSADTFFNGGVMLIDCVKWREHQMSRVTIETCRLYDKRMCSKKNEPGINIALRNKWHSLDCMWNYLPNSSKYTRAKILHYYGIHNKTKPRTGRLRYAGYYCDGTGRKFVDDSQ